MKIKPIAGAGIVAAALALAGCTPPHPHHHAGVALRTVGALDCPSDQGDLTRKSAGADGKSCLYAAADGAEVALQLIALNGQDPKTALAPLEAQLREEMPPAAKAKSASAAGAGDTDRVDIDLPGVHIHANGHDDAQIEAGAGGVRKSVVIKDGQTVVTASKPGVTISAHDNGAEIRVNERGSGVRLSYILASDSPGPHGFKTVGYEARGPSGGPIAVASVKSKSDDHMDGLRHDVRALLQHSVGG